MRSRADTIAATQGLEARGGTPEQFGDYIKGEIAKISKAAGVKAE